VTRTRGGPVRPSSPGARAAAAAPEVALDREGATFTVAAGTRTYVIDRARAAAQRDDEDRADEDDADEDDAAGGREAPGGAAPAGSGSLPFTGLALIGLVAGGLLLAGLGAALRRGARG